MNFETTKQNLNNSLQFVVGITGSKSVNLPILNNILIDASKNCINLISTNLELGITSILRGKVEEVGSFTVPAKLLIDFITTLPEGNVKIVQKNNNLIITGGKQKGVIRGVSAEDFPLIPKTERDKSTVINIDNILGGLQAVVTAVSTSETRPEISGCLFKFSGQELTLVGTDSFRLCEKKVKIQKNVHTGSSIIIPLKTVQELIKILNLSLKLLFDDKILEVCVSENQVLFKLSTVELVSRLIDGIYPDYQQIIPTTHNQEIIINTNDFIQVVKSVTIFSEQGIFDISLTTKSGGLLLSAQTNQSGEGEALVSAQISGGEFSLVLNSRYLLDSLNSFTTEEVLIQITSPETPCVLKPVKKDESNNHLYVIMPIKQ